MSTCKFCSRLSSGKGLDLTNKRNPRGPAFIFRFLCDALKVKVNRRDKLSGVMFCHHCIEEFRKVTALFQDIEEVIKRIKRTVTKEKDQDENNEVILSDVKIESEDDYSLDEDIEIKPTLMDFEEPEPFIPTTTLDETEDLNDNQEDDDGEEDNHDHDFQYSSNDDSEDEAKQKKKSKSERKRKSESRPKLVNTTAPKPTPLLCCPLCIYTTPKVKAFATHLVRKHEAEFPFNCSRCKTVLPSEEILNEHTRLHNCNKFPADCSLCSETIQKRKWLSAHFLRKHVSKERRPEDGNTHNLANDGEKKYRCRRCKFVCHNRHDIIRHRNSKEHALNVKGFSCDVPHCLKQFQSDNGLYAHLAKHELDPKLEKDIECPEPNCGRKFASAIIKERHVRYHGLAKAGRTLICPYCEYRFFPKDTNKLDSHIMNKHKKGALNHLCATCGKQFISTGLLRFHERQKHPELLTNFCEDCEACYTCPEMLRMHKKTHIGPDDPEGYYICTICKGTKKISHLDILKHLSAHNGDSYDSSSSTLSVSCNFCPMTFPSRYVMLQHRSTEHGIPLTKKPTTRGFTGPFICNLCGETLASLGSYTSHKSRMHRGSSKNIRTASRNIYSNCVQAD